MILSQFSNLLIKPEELPFKLTILGNILAKNLIFTRRESIDAHVGLGF
jgi:hypothetical protein